MQGLFAILLLQLSIGQKSEFNMAAEESLFSLEIFVENVELIHVKCRKPVIAFRLLDFQMISISPAENEPKCCHGMKKIWSGKSCLFKMNGDNLQQRLQSSPLYIMLLDSTSEKMLLLASTSISLVKCCEKVFRSIQDNGLDFPAVSGDQSIFEMFNLMGSVVAMIKLRLRLFSFGSSLGEHIDLSIERANQTDDYDKGTKDDEKVPAVLQTAVGDIKTHSLESKTSTSIIKKDAYEACKCNSIVKANAQTQTSVRNLVEKQTDLNTLSSSLQTVLIPEEMISITQHNNIVRPPPLYYNSKSTFPMSNREFTSTNDRVRHSMQTSGKALEETGNELLGGQIDNVDMCLIEPQYCEPTSLNQPSGKGSSQWVQPKLSSYSNQLALPLIEALLKELSLITDRCVENFSSPPNNGNVVCAQSRNKSTISDTKVVHTVTKKTKQQKTTDSNKMTKFFPERTSVKSKSRESRPKGVLISRRTPLMYKQTPLRYGTTKTHRLRQARNKRIARGDMTEDLQLREQSQNE